MDWNAFSTHIRHLPEGDQTIIRKAFEVGKKAHDGQKRQSGEAYFTHPIAVAEIIAKLGGDADTIAAALLHDTVEDTDVTLDDINKDFGTNVTHLIDGATKLMEADFEQRPTLDERIETLRKMFNLMQVDVRIMILKLADRLHNMQTIGFRPRDKQVAVARETQEIYVKIADRLCMRTMRDELESLCLAVLEPDLHQHLKDMRKHDGKASSGIIATMREKLGANQSFDIEYEMKSWDSLRKQYEGSQSGRSKDLINVIFVCDTTDACYLTLGLLHQTWQRETLTFEDYINAPLINGYEGLHTTVILSDGTRARCKIRTKKMHAYDTKGIALYCFDKEALGIMNYLPWTKRIMPLSADTQDRSKDFWESLRSDILGESNLIHGEMDSTQLLPKGATALDGIFYLYGERGLSASSVAVNDKIVPFHEELKYGDTVFATFAAAPQVTLKWLQFIHTGIGGAFVRRGLGRQDSGVKAIMGQKLLQNYLTMHKRGFLSEFERGDVEEILLKKGLPPLDQMYEQIAEGRITPQEVEEALFEQGAQTDEQIEYTIQCTVPLANRMIFLDTLRYYTIKNLHKTSSTPTHRNFRVTLQLNAKELEMLSLTFDNLLGEDGYAVQKKSAFYRASIASAVLVILWGLDPTVGYTLLQNPMISGVDMTIIRFLTLTAISGLFFVLSNRKHPLQQVQISWKNRSLWLSAAFLFFVSLSTYAALEDTPPLKYTIAMTCAGLVMTSIVNRRQKKMLTAMWAFVVAGLTTLVGFAQVWPWPSVIFTFLAVISFTIFSFVSERYKREEQVSQRWSQYFFALSTLCTLMCIPLIPFSTLYDLSAQQLLSIVIFSIICTGLPYYIYYNLLSHKEIDFVLRYSFLIIPATLITQLFFIGVPKWHTGLSAVLIIIGALVPLIDKKRMTQAIHS